MTVPGGFEPRIGSIALDKRGRIAVGLIYSDHLHEPNEYKDVGCCAHVAVVSWQLGARPPAAQILTTSSSPNGNQYGSIEAPQVVIGPDSVTALWPEGTLAPFDLGISTAQLYQAYGTFGAPLEITPLANARDIDGLELSQAPDGSPIAGWLQDSKMVRTAAGGLSGELTPRPREQTLPVGEFAGLEGSRPSESSLFSDDSEGDIFISYLTGNPHASRERLTVQMSHRAGPFGRPRVLARPRHLSFAPAGLVSGGRGRLLAWWECAPGPRHCERMRARSADMSGGLDGVIPVGARPNAFIDAHGRTTVLYRRHHAIYAISATPGRSFGHPQRISPVGRRCTLGYGAVEGETEAPLAASPGGVSLFYMTCRDRPGAERHALLIRYTP